MRPRQYLAVSAIKRERHSSRRRVRIHNRESGVREFYRRKQFGEIQCGLAQPDRRNRQQPEDNSKLKLHQSATVSKIRSIVNKGHYPLQWESQKPNIAGK